MELCGSKDLGSIAGGSLIDSAGGATATGDFFCIYAFNALTVTVKSSNILPNGNSLTGIVIPAGGYFYGRFSSVTSTSGKGCCYNNK